MADKRIQQYPEKVAPSTSDYLLVADAEDVDVNGYLKYKKVKISSLDNIVITNAEDITLTAINTLISTNALVIGRFYRITNSASGVNPILVQSVALNVLSDIGISSVNGTVYNYDISTDTVSIPYAGVYVPYTGATTNVDLGEYQIKVGQLELDQTPTGTFGVGKIRWNDTDGTPEVMLKGANVTLQIGQEQLARVVNKTNTNLTEAGYQVVRISGAQGQRLKVGLAQANSTSTCKDTLGLVTENISNNAEGFITTSGLVRGINTTGSLQGETWADGDRIYLSPSVAGGITNVEPSAPNIVIVLGYVVYAHANQGSIYVSVEGAKALHELFDVSIPTPTNNNVLVYESSTGLWKDKSISTILGFTPIANNATVGGELSGTLPNPSLVTSAVTGKALTGLSVSGSAVVSTDSILTGIGKLQNQINAVVGSVNFQGVWNASTNSPSLASGVGTKGYYYVVSVAGSTNLNGITDWKLGDWAIYDGSAWQKVDNTDAVVSVNGYTGIVTLAAADVGALPTSAISGTTGKLPKFTASGTIGDSIITEGSGGVSINGSLPNTDTTIHSTKSATNFLDLQSTTINQTVGVISRSASKSYFTGLNYSAVDIWEVYDITSGASRLKIGTTGQIITQGATDTGEAHIFGGSARVNGNTKIYGKVESYDTPAGAIAFMEGFAGTAYFGSSGTDNIDLYNGGSTKLRVTSTGNVGIGITSPAYKLSINGNAGIEASEEYFYFHSDYAVGSNARGKIRAVGAGGGSGFGGDLRFSSRASNNAWNEDVLVINSSGNVGIGLTSPSEKLEVQNGTAGARIKASNTGGGNISFGISSNATSVADITFTNALSLIGGNVGIGTTSPLAPLHIKGNGTNSYNSTFITTNSYTDGVSGSILRFGHISTSGNQVAIIDNLFAGGTLVGGLSLNPTGGNVLIGTTTDDGVNKLQVSGSAKIGGNITMTPSTSLIYGGDTVGLVAMTNSDLASYIRIFGSSYAGTPNDIEFITNSVKRLTIASTGAATFSSSVSMSTFGKITSVTPYLELADTNWGASSFVQTGVNAGATAGGDYFNIYNPSGKGFSYVRGGTIDFQISTTGAATFSSSVSASNVLVGTTTASYPLFVVSSGAGVNTQIQNSNSYAHLRLQSGGTNQNAYFTLNCTGTGVGVFQLNDTDRMSIKPNTINISSLPTSSSGLSAGDLWNNGGVVSIV